MQFGLPHLGQRGFERRLGFRIEQSRRLGNVVHMAELGDDVAFLAERRGFLPRARRMRMLVVIVMLGAVLVCGVRSLFGGFGMLGMGLGFFAEKLAVAQAQDFLIDADRVRTRKECLVVEFRFLALQGFAVDDDLAQR